MSEQITLQELVTQIIEDIGLDPQNPSMLPDPAAINYYVFENDRKLFLEQDVECQAMEIARLILRWNLEDRDIPVEQRKPITLYVMSGGGSLYYMWTLVDIMLASKTPIITVNLGLAASAASLIFLAGSQRLMLQNSVVVIHQGSTELSGDANKILDTVDNYKTELERMKAYILSRTTIPVRLFNKKNKDDWYIDPKTCMEYGICHTLVESIDQII